MLYCFVGRGSCAILNNIGRGQVQWIGIVCIVTCEELPERGEKPYQSGLFLSLE